MSERYLYDETTPTDRTAEIKTYLPMCARATTEAAAMN